MTVTIKFQIKRCKKYILETKFWLPEIIARMNVDDRAGGNRGVERLLSRANVACMAAWLRTRRRRRWLPATSTTVHRFSSTMRPWICSLNSRTLRAVYATETQTERRGIPRPITCLLKHQPLTKHDTTILLNTCPCPAVICSHAGSSYGCRASCTGDLWCSLQAAHRPWSAHGTAPAAPALSIVSHSQDLQSSWRIRIQWAWCWLQAFVDWCCSQEMWLAYSMPWCLPSDYFD